MKKILLAIFITGLLASTTFAADSNVVSSANVVGYVQTEVPSNTFSLVTCQFITTNELGVTIDEAFGTSMPNGTQLYVFDETYTTYSYIDGIGWLDESFVAAGNVLITRGQSFWIKNPQGTALNLTLSGDVPGNDVTTTTNALAEGFTLVASAYPASIALADLNIAPVDGDKIYVFLNGSYTTYSYIDGMGWLDESFADATNIVIDVGVGFWYKTAVARDWVQSIPYSL